GGGGVVRPAAQGVGVQDEAVGDLQLPQPFGAEHQDPGPGEEGAQGRVEGRGAVAGGLGGPGEDRLGRLPGVVGDQQGGGGARDAAGAGVGRVFLGRCHPQRRADALGRGQAGALLPAEVVVQGLEGGGPGRRLGQLAGAQQSVEDEGHRGLARAVRGGGGGGQDELQAAPAEPAPQHRLEPGVLAQQGDGGGDGLRGAGQAQGPAGQGSGGAGRVQQQCGGGDADLAGVRGVGGVVVRSGAGSLAEAEPSGECGGPLGHAVGGGVLEGGHHQPGQSRVPVGGQHVGVVEEFGGHLAGEGGGVVPGALQGEV